MPEKLPSFEEVVADLKNVVVERQTQLDKVLQAFFYHCSKNELDTRDGLLVLASAFAFIRDTQEAVDQQTEIKILFLSMIENLPDKPLATPS